MPARIVSIELLPTRPPRIISFPPGSATADAREIACGSEPIRLNRGCALAATGGFAVVLSQPAARAASAASARILLAIQVNLTDHAVGRAADRPVRVHR